MLAHAYIAFPFKKRTKNYLVKSYPHREQRSSGMGKQKKGLPFGNTTGFPHRGHLIHSVSVPHKRATPPPIYPIKSILHNDAKKNEPKKQKKAIVMSR